MFVKDNSFFFFLKCNELFFDFIKFDYLCELSLIWNICCKFYFFLKFIDCLVEIKKNVL